MTEIILIKTDQGEKIKYFLQQENIDYEIYYQEAENEDEFWRRSVRLASQDQQRNKEIVAWDKIASKIKDK